METSHGANEVTIVSNFSSDVANKLMWGNPPVPSFRPGTSSKGEDMMKMLITPTVLALALFTITLATSANADEWNKKTVITVKGGAVQIQGTVLEPGQYVLKLADSQSDRRILQIFNADETKLQTTILANTTYRFDPTRDTRFTLTELPATEPPAITNWFYPGDNYGLQFSVR
jgi:hypothetical protein